MAGGAMKIMVIRHAEKPDEYYDQSYQGVNAAGELCGKGGSESLVTLGRQGGCVEHVVRPTVGPKTPALMQAAHNNVIGFTQFAQMLLQGDAPAPGALPGPGVLVAGDCFAASLPAVTPDVRY